MDENNISIDLPVEDWGNVLMVLQGGVYRVVAPLIMKINNQLIMHQRQQMQLRAPANGEMTDANQPEQVPN